jgi:hypothetical protein
VYVHVLTYVCKLAAGRTVHAKHDVSAVYKGRLCMHADQLNLVAQLAMIALIKSLFFGCNSLLYGIAADV